MTEVMEMFEEMEKKKTTKPLNEEEETEMATLKDAVMRFEEQYNVNLYQRVLPDPATIIHTKNGTIYERHYLADDEKNLDFTFEYDTRNRSYHDDIRCKCTIHIYKNCIGRLIAYYDQRSKLWDFCDCSFP